jgi:hypothetical protein
MLSPLPRRVTFEHEAAHCVVAHAGRGDVRHVDLELQRTLTGESQGRAEWGWGHGGMNTMLAGFVAGPAQTAIYVERNDLDPKHVEAAMWAEAGGVAPALVKLGASVTPTSMHKEMTKHFGVVKSFLETVQVAAAVQTIADALEQAETAGKTRVLWSEIQELVDWQTLPPIPELVPAK